MAKKLLWIFVGAFVVRLILSFVVSHPDINNHIDWGIRFWEYGPAKFFAPETNIWSYTWPNQPPGSLYMFAGIRKLFEFVFGLFWFVNVKVPAFPSVIITFFESNLYPALLKLPSIVSDIGIGVLIYKIILLLDIKNKEKKAFWAAVVWLVNPVVWYNSAVWGQTDAIINFLALGSFYFLFKRRVVPAIFLILLSFYVKVSLTIFLPVFAIVVLRQKYKIADLLKGAAIPLAVIGLATLPFSRGEPFGWLVNLYQTKILGQQLQIITANAFNVWAAIAGIHEQPQALLLGPLSYQAWGIILFAVSYFPLLYMVWKKQDAGSVVVALALTAFSSWMLLTNMHERYLYPLFPYLTILAGAGLVSLPSYILISFLNLLNLYNFWWVPEIGVIKSFLSFGNRVMPRILGLVNFGLFVQLYFHLTKSVKAK